MPHHGWTAPIDLRDMSDVPRYRSLLSEPEPRTVYGSPPQPVTVCRCGRMRAAWVPRCDHGAGAPPPAVWVDTFTLRAGLPCEQVDPPTVELPAADLVEAASRPRPMQRRRRRLRPGVWRRPVTTRSESTPGNLSVVRTAPDHPGPVDDSGPDVDPDKVAQIAADLRTRVDRTTPRPISGRWVRRHANVGAKYGKAAAQELERALV